MQSIRDDIVPNCQNCDYEYYCREHKEKPCESWRPDLNYKRMLESGKGREEKADEKD